MHVKAVLALLYILMLIDKTLFIERIYCLRNIFDQQACSLLVLVHVALDADVQFIDAALQTDNVLLQLHFLLLERRNLVLQLDVFDFLDVPVAFEFFLNSCCFALQRFAYLSCLVREHIFELLVLLSNHLYFTLTETNVLVNRADHILEKERLICSVFS